jgi:hypothetical protein
MDGQPADECDRVLIGAYRGRPRARQREIDLVERAAGSLNDLIFERDALGIIFLELFFRGVNIRKNLHVVGVANLFGCINVDKDGH